MCCNYISEGLEFIGYIPIIGSFFGTGRLATGGLIAAVATAAFSILSCAGRTNESNFASKVALRAANEFAKGGVELFPFIKLVVKWQEGWDGKFALACFKLKDD